MPSEAKQRLALGTVQFGLAYGVANHQGQLTQPEARAMLEVARLHQIDTLDTAAGYGESEARLGEIGTRGFKLVTKLPPIPQGCQDVSAWVDEQVGASLKRLGVAQVYGLLLHRPEQLLGSDGPALYRALLTAKESGRTAKVGVSVYAPHELDLLSARYRFDLVQAPFNLVDQRLRSSGWLRRLHEQDVEVHTRSAFLQGLLLMSHEAIPTKFMRWSDLWRTWHGWLACQPVSALQACLAFVLAVPEVSRVVIGADSVIQLREIVAAASLAAPHDFPDLHCDDEDLLNPGRWSRL